MGGNKGGGGGALTYFGSAKRGGRFEKHNKILNKHIFVIRKNIQLIV